MKLNDKCYNLIKEFEGLELNAYPDPATKNDPIKKGEPWTIGYGTTIYPNGLKVKKGDVITAAKATEFLISDVTKFSQRVLSLVKKPLTDNQFGAIVSFAYNLGVGNLSSSTLLKKLNINPDDSSITSEFLKWNKANGRVLNGLTKRRTQEAQLYFS